MILLNVASVTKHYGPEPVLAGTSFEIRPGERVGLVGPNGAGKTTLLRIVAGIESPDSGRAELHLTARMAYLEQQPQLAAGSTVWQEARQGLSHWIAIAEAAEQAAHALAGAADPADRERLGRQFDHLQHQLHLHGAYNLDHKIERVLTGLGFAAESLHQPVEQLSGGQQNRLILARLLLAEPDLMLLDEPSNHLDIEATQWLETFLTESDSAILVVSHDRYFLDAVTNRTLELFHGTVDSFQGNFSAYWRQKQERLEFQQRTYDRQAAQIARTEDFIRRNHYGQKHAQAKDREKKLARIERVAPPRQIAAPTMGFPPAKRSGDIVLRAEHLAKAYDRPLFAELSFQIERGQRWGILGPNGCGKTTLLRCLVGRERPDAGRVHLGTGVTIGYCDQLLAELDAASLVVEAIRPDHKELNEPRRRELLARFGLTGDLVFQTVDSLSGGERSRAALARVSAGDGNFLVLDEPTNHLDLWARDALERSLTAFEGTVLFVSHDRYFLNRVADHLLVVEPGRFRVVEGDYDDYLNLVGRGPADDTEPNGGSAAGKSASAARNSSGDTAAPRRRRFPYRKVEDLELEILSQEARLEALHSALGDPDLYKNASLARETKAEIASVQEAIARLVEHYEEALELN